MQKTVLLGTARDITLFKPYSTRGESNGIAFELIMPLAEVLKRGQWSNESTFFHYFFRGTEDDEYEESEKT